MAELFKYYQGLRRPYEHRLLDGLWLVVVTKKLFIKKCPYRLDDT